MIMETCIHETQHQCHLSFIFPNNLPRPTRGTIFKLQIMYNLHITYYLRLICITKPVCQPNKRFEDQLTCSCMQEMKTKTTGTTSGTRNKGRHQDRFITQKTGYDWRLNVPAETKSLATIERSSPSWGRLKTWHEHYLTDQSINSNSTHLLLWNKENSCKVPGAPHISAFCNNRAYCHIFWADFQVKHFGHFQYPRYLRWTRLVLTLVLCYGNM